jgi:hypothetical protein
MRSLKNLCYEEIMKNELHEKAKAAANEYQNCEIKLIQILKEIDTSKVFLKMGYSSLFVYITEALGLSEAVAYNLSTVVRKSKEVPELQKAIENGLALSKARKIVPVLTKENSGVWLEKAKTLPKADLEREVAAVSPYVAKRESVRAVSMDRYSLKLEISMKLKRELARAQTLESNRKKKSVKLEEMLEEVVKFYLEHKDPLVKAERVMAKKNISNQNPPKKRPPSIGSFSWGRGSEEIALSPERDGAFGYPCKSVGRMADLSRGQGNYEGNNGAGGVVMVALVGQSR